MDKTYKVFWLAGESSGDLHASLVMRELNRSVQNIRHIGIGGTLMQREGLKALFPFDRFAIMGFVEVVKHLFFFIGVERTIKRTLAKERPDLAILVDYPGLNLRIARIADDLRVPVLYFISPQFWAWKRKRVYKLKENVRHVACILPFEKELLDIYNVTSTYVGHPIAEEIEYELDRLSFAKFFGLDPDKEWIGFMPGSREAEVERLLPGFLETAAELHQQGYQIMLSKARSISPHVFSDLVDRYKKCEIKIVDGYRYEMMKYAKLLVACSGTVTLEAAFIGTPVIICYKASPLSYLIARHFVRIKRIGLPNIILEEDLLPELVQDDVNARRIVSAARRILDDHAYYTELRARLLKLRGMLEGKRCSVEMVKLIRRMLSIDV